MTRSALPFVWGRWGRVVRGAAPTAPVEPAAPGLGHPPEPLHVDVDELAGPTPLVARGTPLVQWWEESAEPVAHHEG